jgi:hypothetical protein
MLTSGLETVHPEFTVLLARQRSGTNALRSVLGTHPEICCFDEVFKITDRFSDDPLIKASNYFTFLEQYCAGDVTKAYPDRYKEVFVAFLAYLRGLTTKRLIVIDVKYNSTHHVSDVWREITDPTFFDLLKTQGIGVLQLTRRNLLRCLLSNLKAWKSQHYHIPDGRPRADASVSLPAEWTLARMETWSAEDERVAASFDGYPLYKRVEYTDLFPDATGAIGKAALTDLAGWFGVDDAFVNRASYLKLSSLPLDQTVENIDELRAAFHGTRFAAYLEDEPAYR